MIEQKISSLLTTISEEPSRTGKISLLEAGVGAFDAEELAVWEEILNKVYRVDYSYGIKYNPSWEMVDRYGEHPYSLDCILDLFDDLLARRITGNAALNQTELYIRHAKNQYVHHIARVILERNLDCGIDRKTITKLYPSLLPFAPSMMKCEPAEEKTLRKAVYPAMLQLKIDAMRVNAEMNESSDEITYWTFNGNSFEINSDDLNAELNHLRGLVRDSFGEDVFFDGELQIWALGKPLDRKKSNGLANRILKGTAPLDIHEQSHIVLWDVLDRSSVVSKKSKMTNQERFDILKSAMESHSYKYIHLVEHCEVGSEEEAYDQVMKWINRGEEGGVLKNKEAVWEGKRSANCIKFKAERECDLRVVGIIPGTKKYTGMIGSLICESADGIVQVDVGTGLSDEDRTRDDLVGKVISVLFNEVITNDKNKNLLSLFLPRLLEIRSDKDEADTASVIKAAKGLKVRE